MSHELDLSNDRANMAYVGETPWHGLGNSLSEGSSIETWIQEAGMSYEVLSSPLKMALENEEILVPNKMGLYRSDTKAPLGVVGNRYHVVQPQEVMEFFRDLTEERGFIMNTAGVLFGGSKYWAMARTPHRLQLGNDKVQEYLLLATACDGSMATTARYVRTRVVCHNTLQLANSEKGGLAIRVEHRSRFNASQVKKELRLLNESWEQFQEDTTKLAARKVSYEEAANYYINLLGTPELPMDDQTSKKPEELYLNFVQGNYIGSNLEAAHLTAWGLVNVVTEHVDWAQGSIQDRRLKSAWFGKGADLKTEAYNAALALI